MGLFEIFMLTAKIVLAIVIFFIIAMPVCFILYFIMRAFLRSQLKVESPLFYAEESSLICPKHKKQLEKSFSPLCLFGVQLDLQLAYRQCPEAECRHEVGPVFEQPAKGPHYSPPWIKIFFAWAIRFFDAVPKHRAKPAPPC